MTECTEIADNMAKVAPHFATFDDALAWVKQRMPDQGVTVRDNVAWSLYQRQRTLTAVPHATTTPTPLSARLATMAEQLEGFIAPSDLCDSDREELRTLASALAAASADAAKLEGRVSTRDEKVARWMADPIPDTTATEREPDRDTDQHGNTWRNTDGEG